MWVGHGSGRDREQTWVVELEESVERKRIRDSTTEYRRAFTASRKIFRTGIIETLSGRGVYRCVARSIDRGYVLLQTWCIYIYMCVHVLERKLMRGNLN